MISMQGMTLDAAQKGVAEVSKETLRQVIDSAVERAFRAGSQWALIRTEVDSPKAGRQVDQWMRAQEPPSLRIIQQATREQLYKALVEAFVGGRRAVTFEQASPIVEARLYAGEGVDRA